MGTISPLQLITASGLLQNQGLKPIPAALSAAIAAYNATTVMQNFFAAVDFYKSRSYFTESTLDSLLSIGNSVCPALGNSIPVAPVGTYTNLINEYLTINTVTDDSTVDPSGFSELIRQTADAYLGDGDYGQFCQGFMAVAGYVNTVNQFINAEVNSQTYLGPTFTSMSSLTTSSISDITANIDAFGTDLTNLGSAIDLGNLDWFGTPSALLRQISRQGNIVNGTTPALRDALVSEGLTQNDIANLVNQNVVSLFNPNGLSDTQFDALQKRAYPALTKVQGADLLDILNILNVSTPNIASVADLLNPVKIFPNSYTSLRVPTAAGFEPIYKPDGTVDMSMAAQVDQVLPTPSGCDQLGKIIPPDQAVANKALQLSLQQIPNVATASLPVLAQAVQENNRQPWDINREYMMNDVVALAPASPATGLAQLLPTTQLYRAQQYVPAGTNILDTNYWQPIDQAALNTMSGLNLIESLTAPVPASVDNFYTASVATGSGPNGVITICDVIGTAYDYWDFASRLNTATTAVNTLQTAGSLTALNTAYTNILAAANDAAVLVEIANANAAISALSANPQVTVLNTAWTYMANYLNREKGYQIQAGVDYFALLAGEKVSVYGFVQNLSQYGQDLTECGTADFLLNVANTATLSGQALVGTLRDAANQQRLVPAGLANNLNPSSDPEIRPNTAVIPVN